MPAIRVTVRPVLLLLGGLVLGAVFVAAYAASRTPRAPLTLGDVATLLPRGSEVHSFVRMDLDARLPSAVAVLAIIPRAPGVQETTYQTYVFAYDRWRQRYREVYTAALPGPVPMSVDAGRVLGQRDAAIFSALQDDGTQSYRIVGWGPGGVGVLYEGHVAGALRVADPLLIEQGPRQRALGWDGHGFRERPVPGTLPPTPRGITWHYSVRGDTILARSSSVVLGLRQPLRLEGARGGPIPIVLADSRLDLLETGYRARSPGTYTIRIWLPYLPIDQAYPLTVVVRNT